MNILQIKNQSYHETFISLCIIGSLLTGCSNNNNTVVQHKEDTVTAPLSESKVVNHQDESPTFKLLQGKWQHTEDKTNILEFSASHRREIAEGMTEWSDEPFVLSDHCLNESDSSSSDAKEADGYISCKESDLCWSIVSLDSSNLTLMYMGRGNLLTYKRVKK